MEKIIEYAKQFEYSSLEYVEPEDLTDTNIFLKDDNSMFLYQTAADSRELYWTSKSKHNIHLHWASNSKESFLNGLNKTISHIKQAEKNAEKLYIEFVPESFLEDMTNMGFVIASEWVDFWNSNLTELNVDLSNSVKIRNLRNNEIPLASEITKRCSDYSRGFTGQSETLLEEWIKADNSYLFAAELEGNLIGLGYVLLYGFDSEKGTVLWVRELAVDPMHQSKGIGRQLISHGIHWGKGKGAKRSFLACDAENHHAIKLYESLGYTRSKGRGQINMECFL